MTALLARNLGTTGVEYIRSDGYNYSFLDTPHHLDRYSNCSRVMLKKKYMGRDPKNRGFRGLLGAV